MKKIRMYTISKIKKCQINIFLAQDDDVVNYREVRANERAISHYLDKDGILDKDLRKEIITNVKWYNDNCADDLRKLGWEVLTNDDK